MDMIFKRTKLDQANAQAGNPMFKWENFSFKNYAKPLSRVFSLRLIIAVTWLAGKTNTT